jgi:hypothetical protein
MVGCGGVPVGIGEGVIKEIAGVRVGRIPAVAVVAGAGCPQPATRIAIKITDIMIEIRLIEFIM